MLRLMGVAAFLLLALFGFATIARYAWTAMVAVLGWIFFKPKPKPDPTKETL